MRAAMGADEEESVESEAGAILVAETDHEIGNMAEMMRSWIEAQNNAGG